MKLDSEMAGKNEDDSDDLLKSALVKIKHLKAKLKESDARTVEPIAIIGMSCRFPGGGVNLDAFWRALTEGVDGVRRIPKERWAEEAIALDRPEVRWAGLLDKVDEFDAAFFGIAPREASRLDPQQRLLLEVVWEALERAGARAERLWGSRTGVYIGMCSADYRQFVREAGQFDIYSGTGNAFSTAAGRLSYTLGLEGPCMTIDTACSSSLVAVHLGCQSLRTRESDLAVAGGVGLLLDPTTMAVVAETQALSPEGRCKTFDAHANGFVRGEGCGIVALKRLSDAERDGDPIVAVIRGSAVNQDGRSTGLTAPNVLSQEAMLRQALENARVRAEDIGYVETHGTGTSLGDPIEFEALRAVLGAPRVDGSRCVLGAVKSNVGHLEAAAGVAGLIKAALCLKHGAIPKNLHFERLNPRMSLVGTPFAIPTENVPWKSNGKPRRAGVSAFGISGTNAHVILEEAPRPEKPATSAKEASSYLLLLSAKSPEALVALARAYQDPLTKPDVSLQDLAYTASVRRSHHEHRLGVVGTSKEEIAAALSAHVCGEARPGLMLGRASGAAPKVVFVFPGQGSQWEGMGRRLLSEEPVFREAMEACDTAIRRDADFSVIEELHAEDPRSRLSEIDVVQPVLFAMEVALCALWRSWGVEPAAVVGHSMGEVAAAYVAGALSVEDAAAVICRRSRLLRKVRGQGAMALVELSMVEANKALASYSDRLSVAVSNGPRSTVIAGDVAALEEVLAELERQKVFCRRVKVDVASHSPQMDAIRAELEAALSGLSPKEARVPMQSTVTGERVSGEELAGDYWADNLRKPVLFSPVIRSLIEAGPTVFVEMSPHPILLPSVEENLREGQAEGAAIASLRRQVDERRSLLEALGRLYMHGYPVAFPRLYPEGGRVIDLPSYPWQRRRYWIEPAASEQSPRGNHDRRSASRRRSLLGDSFSVSALPKTHFWEVVLGVDRPLPLSERRIRNEVSLPWALHLPMVLEAARQSCGEGWELREATFLDEPTLMDRDHLKVQLALTSEVDEIQFSLSSARLSGEEGESPWREYARGGLQKTASRNPAEGHAEEALTAIQERCQELSTEAFYRAIAKRELLYGPALRVVKKAWKRSGEALGRLGIDTEVSEARGDATWVWALLEGCFQLLHAELLPNLPPRSSYRVLGLRGARVLRSVPPEVWGLVRVASGAEPGDGWRASMALLDEAGRVLVSVDEIHLEPVGASHEEDDLEDPATVERIVRGIFRKVTGRSDEDIDVDRRLNETGLDSLMSVQMLRQAEQAFGITITAQGFVRSSFHAAFTFRSLVSQILGLRRADLLPLSQHEAGALRGALGEDEGEALAFQVERVERNAESPPDYRALFGAEIPLETFMITLSSGERMEVVCAGAGAPLLLLPPILASISIWVFQIEEFWRDYRVILPNYPGYGRSTASGALMSPAELARRVAAVLDGLGVHAAVHLVGWSLGGMIGQEFSLSLPHRIRSLALVNTTSHLEEEDSLKNIEDIFRRLLADLQRRTPGEDPELLARRERALEISRREAGYDRSFEYMAEVLRFDASARIHGINAPTLVVQGQEDTLAVPRYGRHMEREIPRAEYQEFRSGGHFVPLHLPRTFNDLLRAFLRKWSA